MIRYNNSTHGDRVFSNFFHCNVTINLDGRRWTFMSVENAYQCLKQRWLTDDTVRPFLSCSPNQARQMGRNVEMRPDWDQVKLKIMTQLCRIKFQDPVLKARLLRTGDEELVHLSPWDKFWGVDHEGNGRNEHGIILMHLREELL